MNEQNFWAIVECAHEQAQDSMYGKCEAITAEIAKLSNEDALAFAEIFDSMMDKAYTWSLWGAAYFIHGGCADDAFSDFRATLISRGQAVFEKSIAFPDETLAEETLDEDDLFYEGYAYAVTEGVEAAAGLAPERKTAQPSEPVGEKWLEKDLATLYPKINERIRVSW